MEPHLFADAIYRFEGRAAARHLFPLGSGLDSMVIGEPHILGQLKDSTFGRQRQKLWASCCVMPSCIIN